MTPRRRTIWERWIGLLMLAWPRPFRERFGRDLADQYPRPDSRTVVRAVAAARELVRGGVGARLDDIRRRREPRAARADGWLLDLRQAWRGVTRRPLFAASVVTTLAIAAALNIGVFSILDTTLLRPLPYPGERALVSIGSLWTGYVHSAVSLPEYVDYRNRARAFESIAVFSNSSVNLPAGAGPAERAQGTRATASLFDVLGIRPALGRVYTGSEETAGEPVVVLSHAFWLRRFAGDPNVIGRPLATDSGSRTVLGVMPPGFEFPNALVDLWIPMTIVGSDTGSRGAHNRQVIARLRDGVTLAQAQDEMRTIARQLAEEHPGFYPEGSGWGISVLSLRDRLVGDYRPALQILMTAVTFVLLIACANVANLMVARMTERGREIATRKALGAPSYRILREAAAEGGITGAAAGILGLCLAAWLLGGLRPWLPDGLPLPASVLRDARTIAFALVATGLAGAVTAALATLRATRGQAVDVLRGARSVTDAPAQRARTLLTVAQVALAVMLLVGGSFAARSFQRLLATDPGLRTDDVATARVTLSSTRHRGPAARVAFFDRLQAELESQPGVLEAGAISMLPLTGQTSDWTFGVEGRVLPAGSQNPAEQARVVHGEYFELMGIRLVQGRFFAPSDTPASPPVAIVSELLARKYWPDGDPIGRRIRRWGPDSDEPWSVVVGVVSDIRHLNLATAPAPMLYFPAAQVPEASMTILARLRPGESRGTRVIADAVRAVDPDQPVWSARMMEDWRARSVAAPRFSLMLLATFAVLAVALASIGVYGVMAFGVSLRTRELGIRVALGARPGSLMRDVLRRAALMAAIGTAIGGAAALATGSLLGHVFHDVRTADPVVLAGVPLLVLTIALAASVLPARRAMRADPAEALRID